jgi:hypothetical protein
MVSIKSDTAAAMQDDCCQQNDVSVVQMKDADNTVVIQDISNQYAPLQSHLSQQTIVSDCLFIDFIH